jgi:hypothetical protein
MLFARFKKGPCRAMARRSRGRSLREARLHLSFFSPAGCFGLPALVVAVLGGLVGPVAAQTVLTLSRADGAIALSLSDLETLPQHQLTTANEFVDQPVTYRGPLARDVLALFDLDRAPIVRFTALNDYYIDVPTSDLHRYDVILAMEANGRRLSRRDKGPLWLMYPISDFPELSDPRYHARLIWQVVTAEAPCPPGTQC